MWLCLTPASWKAADSACSSQTDSGHSRRFFAMPYYKSSPRTVQRCLLQPILTKGEGASEEAGLQPSPPAYFKIGCLVPYFL